MNLKMSAIFILILLSLILCVGSVSAENVTEVDSTDAAQDGSVQVDDVQQSVSDSQVPAVSQQSTKKIDTDTDVDDVVVGYKKNEYLKVNVKNDDTNKPIKKLKLKVKVFTKSKSKTYTIITNNKGIAKFNTNVLGLGDHKVVITSSDNKYKVSDTAHIFVGKKHTVTLKPNTIKKLKNKDVLRVYTVKDGNEKDIKVGFKSAAKKTNIVKAVFFLKNKSTGKIIKKVDYTDFDHGKWQYPSEDFSNRYTAVKVQITYVTV